MGSITYNPPSAGFLRPRAICLIKGTLDKLQVLADLLGVSPDWLRWGVVQGPSANETQPLYVKQPRPDGSSIQSLTQDVRLLNDSHLKLVQALVTAMLVEQKQKDKVTVGVGE